MTAVDVAVPCYNYGYFLKTCVDSVLSQRNVDVFSLLTMHPPTTPPQSAKDWPPTIHASLFGAITRTLDLDYRSVSGARPNWLRQKQAAELRPDHGVSAGRPWLCHNRHRFLEQPTVTTDRQPAHADKPTAIIMVRATKPQSLRPLCAVILERVTCALDPCGFGAHEKPRRISAGRPCRALGRPARDGEIHAPRAGKTLESRPGTTVANLVHRTRGTVIPLWRRSAITKARFAGS
jgi:hypothetical protein